MIKNLVGSSRSTTETSSPINTPTSSSPPSPIKIRMAPKKDNPAVKKPATEDKKWLDKDLSLRDFLLLFLVNAFFPSAVWIAGCAFSLAMICGGRKKLTYKYIKMSILGICGKVQKSKDTDSEAEAGNAVGSLLGANGIVLKVKGKEVARIVKPETGAVEATEEHMSKRAEFVGEEMEKKFDVLLIKMAEMEHQMETLRGMVVWEED